MSAIKDINSKVSDERVFEFIKRSGWPMDAPLTWKVDVTVLKVALLKINELERQIAEMRKA